MNQVFRVDRRVQLVRLFRMVQVVQVPVRSTNLTVTAVMTGGTQLVEGAYLTGGDTRFCRE